MKELTLGLVCLLLTGACGGPGRFALRSPLLRDTDDQPFSPAPAEDEEPDIANATDVMVVGPLARLFLFETGSEAHNANSLDEVPDSTWFTNRDPSPAEVARGPCPSLPPTPPFVVQRLKSRGVSPGFVVEDANEQRYMVKLDTLVSTQPEINTAADATVARLYWAVGFNAPCNEVLFLRRDQLLIGEGSRESGPLGARRSLTRTRLDDVLDLATPGPDGTLRMSASRFIEGRPVGTWRAEGVRRDDPNDLIPHENRRELRGERWLAAWVAHWDSRGPNTFDSYVQAEGGGGYVVHYFLDFADSLGAVPTRTDFPVPRMGHATVVDFPNILLDAVTLGLLRRSWDDVRADPRYPNLGFFDVDHFSPMSFAAQTPQLRWERAQAADLGWMARHIARLGPRHVRAAVRVGRLSNPDEERRMVEVLLGRRRRILRASFDQISPLADLTVTPAGRACATDLGLTTALSRADEVTYDARVWQGNSERDTSVLVLRAEERGRVCVDLPSSFAPPGASDGAPERYAILELERTERGQHTVLRAHVYDLGPRRGYVLVGIERPA